VVLLIPPFRTTLAVAGDNFAIIGADTRLSDGYNIKTRNYSKLCKLTDKCVLASSGMQADILALQKNLKAALEIYEHNNGKTMSTPAIAQHLSNTLYYKRFFPYYAFNVLAGVDELGVGCVWSYDAVGSHERCKYSSSGTGQQLIQPLLDNLVAQTNQTIKRESPLTSTEAEDIIRDALNSAGERDIYTGDFMDVAVIDAVGVTFKKFPLKFD
jgi:20S proteasome subunit beta 6